MKTVLIFVKYETILDVIDSHLSEHNYETITTSEEEEAIEIIKNKDFDAILIGGGINKDSRQKVLDIIKEEKPETKIVEHYGGPYTVIDSVKAAFSKD